MSKRDLGSKLKTRLGEWQAYGDQPVPPQGPPSEHIAHRESMLSGNDLSQDLMVVSSNQARRVEIPLTMEPVQPEQKIAALQAALEHERDQTRRLLDVAAREKVMHAVTLKSPSENRFTPGGPSVSDGWKTRRRETHITIPKTPRPTAWLILVALASLIGCAYLAYTWIKPFFPVH